jgi:hypothetical protein
VRRLALMAAVVGLVALCSISHASIAILDTGPRGFSPGGTALYENHYFGSRFEIFDPIKVTELGGFINGVGDRDHSLFAAVVPVSGPELLPQDVDLGDAIYSSVFIPPLYGSAAGELDTVIQTNFILNPGNYALVFGSGLFGATGDGFLQVRSDRLDYVQLNKNQDPNAFRSINGQGTRMFVTGENIVPEFTASIIWAVMGLSALCFRLRRRG